MLIRLLFAACLFGFGYYVGREAGRNRLDRNLGGDAAEGKASRKLIDAKAPSEGNDDWS